MDDDMLYINVSNTGQKINDADKKRVFERLYRIDPSRNIESGGVGLGLAIARRCVELHFGSITVQNQKDDSTSFCIALPIQYATAKFLP